MIQVVETEVTRWEFAGLDLTPNFSTIRGHAIVMWWTPVEELDAWILNLFAPREHVWWNLAQYRAFTNGKTAYAHNVRERERTAATVDAFIRDCGVSPKSAATRHLLDGITWYLGDRYFQEGGTFDPGFLSGRHMSVLVPDKSKAAVSRYFHRQLAIFGDSALIACPETTSLVLESEQDSHLFKLLCSFVPALSMVEQLAILADVRRTEDSHIGRMIGKPDAMKYRARIGAFLHEIEVSKGSKHVSDMLEIMRFRVDVALGHFALPVLESMNHALDSPSWGALDLVDAREQFWGSFDAQLAPFSVVRANPFELGP